MVTCDAYVLALGFTNTPKCTADPISKEDEAPAWKTMTNHVATTFGCCGASKKSACWEDYSAGVCETASDYQPQHTFDAGGGNMMTCDSFAGHVGITSTPNCDSSKDSSKDSSIADMVRYLGGLGCCGSSTKTACGEPTNGGESSGGEDEQSPECKAAEEIVSKDRKELSTDTAHIGQCYDADFSADPEQKDGSKWIYKKGPGSCSICSDQVKIFFDEKCNSHRGLKSGEKCTYCAGAIGAYKDCPKTDQDFCAEAEAIVSLDSKKMSTDTKHSAQCYDGDFSADPEQKDGSKWIYKKGFGSCSICSDQVKIFFDEKCNSHRGLKSGEKCTYCAGAIGAYKDCDVVPVPKFAIAHTIALEGISATEFNDDPKIIASFQSTVATTLGVTTDKIINIKAKSTRRQLSGRGLAAEGCRYVERRQDDFV